MEKKQRAEEKHRAKILGNVPRMSDDEDDAVTVIARDMQMARI